MMILGKSWEHDGDDNVWENRREPEPHITQRFKFKVQRFQTCSAMDVEHHDMADMEIIKKRINCCQSLGTPLELHWTMWSLLEASEIGSWNEMNDTE